LILLIQSDKPGHDQIGLELSIDDKRYVGLPAHEPSYVIVSEVNPYDSPHIQTAPNTFVNSGCCSSMVPKHSISGRNRLSGMVGIRS